MKMNTYSWVWFLLEWGSSGVNTATAPNQLSSWWRWTLTLGSVPAEVQYWTNKAVAKNQHLSDEDEHLRGFGPDEGVHLHLDLAWWRWRHPFGFGPDEGEYLHFGFDPNEGDHLHVGLILMKVNTYILVWSPWRWTFTFGFGPDWKWTLTFGFGLDKSEHLHMGLLMMRVNTYIWVWS